MGLQVKNLNLRTARNLTLDRGCSTSGRGASTSTGLDTRQKSQAPDNYIHTFSRSVQIADCRLHALRFSLYTFSLTIRPTPPPVFKMPTMWLSDTQSTLSPPQACRRSLLTIAQRSESHSAQEVHAPPLLPSGRSNTHSPGGLFLMGGVMMFFDRAMYVFRPPISLSLARALTNTSSRLAMGNVSSHPSRHELPTL